MAASGHTAINAGYTIPVSFSTGKKIKDVVKITYQQHTFERCENEIDGKQLWTCVEKKTVKCGAAVSIMDVEGVTKMKIIEKQHTHSPF